MNTSRLHLILGSVLAGLQAITGAWTLYDPTFAHGAIVLAVSAAQASLAAYLKNATVPTEQVAAKVEDGVPVAGPAATAPTGTLVQVTRVPPPPPPSGAGGGSHHEA